MTSLNLMADKSICHENKTKGILLGTAVADSIGLPMEGISPKRIKKLNWINEKSPLTHHFLLGRGMWSDDTEHTIMLSQALLASHGNLNKFQRSFAWELKWWLLALPAGVGLATARAIIKLWLGYSIKHSGVFSAGNGTAMRAAIIAAYFPDHPKKRQSFTIAQSTLTHTDPKATIGALSVTELSALLIKSKTPPSTQQIIHLLSNITNIIDNQIHGSKSAKQDWKSITNLIQKSWNSNHTETQFLTELNQITGGSTKRGVTGYIYQSLPIAIYSGTKHNWEYKTVITNVISLGGDTDTVAAIAGAMCGAYGGHKSIPHQWLSKVTEWPCSINDLEKLATAISEKKQLRVRPRFSPQLIIRNIIFLAVVITHGFARLIPR